MAIKHNFKKILGNYFQKKGSIGSTGQFGAIGSVGSTGPAGPPGVDLTGQFGAIGSVGSTGPAGPPGVDLDTLTRKILADPDFDPSDYLYAAFRGLIAKKIYDKFHYSGVYVIKDEELDELDKEIMEKIN